MGSLAAPSTSGTVFGELFGLRLRKACTHNLRWAQSALLTAQMKHCDLRGIRQVKNQFELRSLCFSSAWMMSLSSCRVVSACSRALLRGVSSHITNRRVLVNTRLEVLEDGWVDACHGEVVRRLSGDVDCGERLEKTRQLCGCALQTAAKIRRLRSDIWSNVTTNVPQLTTMPQHVLQLFESEFLSSWPRRARGDHTIGQIRGTVTLGFLA
jgi:hypothetical protein